jgi:DeoR/GlpR family transcriptional regulator of sugar metabolism
VKRGLVAACKEVIAVVDSSKWGHLALASFAPTERIRRVISDKGAPPAMVDELRAQGLDVILV